MEEEEKTRNPLVYLLIGFVILVIVFALVSRTQSDSLKGTWSLMGGNPGDGISFDGERAFLREGYDTGTYDYTVNGQTITMTNSDRGETMVWEYKISGKILTLYADNGQAVSFTKE